MILSEGDLALTEIVYVSYCADLDEAGLGKPFDFSTATIADRWRAGKRQMELALKTLVPANKDAPELETAFSDGGT